MTTEQQDALVGRVIRELKAAEENLSRLLVHASEIAKQITSLASDVNKRIERARHAGTIREHASPGTYAMATDGGFERGHLQNYANAVDLAALEALDKEVGQAVAAVLELRQTREALGV